MKLIKLNTVVASALLLLSSVDTHAQTDYIYKNFQNPPAEARPQVWWHWMNGNVSKDGIRKDILWMHNSGITGFHVFDAGMGCPQIVPKLITYLSPEWKDCLKYAVSLADSLHMDVTIAASPGWSCTGGPWVKPEDAMKKITWHSMIINGGRTFKGKLPEAFNATGNFRDMDNGNLNTVKYYKDIAVIAVKLNSGDDSPESLKARLTCSGGNFTLEQLNDEKLKKGEKLTPDSEGKLWIEYTYPQPQTIRALSICDGSIRDNWDNGLARSLFHLECSDNGKDYKKICDIPQGGAYQQTISIPKTTAKHFRLVCDHPQGSGKDAFMHFSEFSLHPSSRVNFAEERAGFSSYSRLNSYPMVKSDDAIPTENVIDISNYADSEGNLNWKAPAGKWQIYRFGYSLTGKVNHPASPQGTGLEVDKLDKAAVNRYLTHYLDIYRDATGGMLGKRGINGLLIDSYEAGNATWTINMPREFSSRRGYELYKWLPVIAGRIIGSSDESERFLYDWRKTIGELIAENLYGESERIAHENGMQTYFESNESSRQYLADGMSVKSHADIPMGAMWARQEKDRLMYAFDLKESSSAAHVYGRRFTAGESMTVAGHEGMAYSFHPGNLKKVADHEMSCGLNRFVIHESAHQPVDDKRPGLSLGQYGQWFNRHETWAKRAKTWTDYLGRSCYMLQLGKNVAQIAYYYGTDNSVTGICGVDKVSVPRGYGYDFIGPDELLKETDIKNKELVTRGGASYKMLWISPVVVKMSVSELRKIAAIAKAGIPVYGEKPLANNELKQNNDEWQNLVNEIWNSGLSNVITPLQTNNPLETAGIAKDIDFPEDCKINYIHRTTPEGDVYWISNASDKAIDTKVSVKAQGLEPQIWHPEDARREKVAYNTDMGRTTVNLKLNPHDAVFLVMVNDEDIFLKATEDLFGKDVMNLDDNWTVNFEEELGAPAEAIFPRLISYTESEDAGIKYFSGTAVYCKEFKMKAKPSKKASYKLNLGKVGNMATVVLNGDTIATLWHEPYEVDITRALHKGVNTLNVEVINPWRNRIIGDRQPGVKKRYTYLGYDNFFDSKSELMPAGLMGPVRIIEETR